VGTDFLVNRKKAKENVLKEMPYRQTNRSKVGKYRRFLLLLPGVDWLFKPALDN